MPLYALPSLGSLSSNIGVPTHQVAMMLDSHTELFPVAARYPSGMCLCVHVHVSEEEVCCVCVILPRLALLIY